MKQLIENGVTFAYLGIQEVEAVEAMIAADNTASFKAQAEAMGPAFTPAQRMDLWMQYRPDRPTVQQVFHYVSNVQKGMVAVVKAAAKKAGADIPDDKLREYDLPNLGNLAAHLLGLEYRSPLDVTNRPEPVPADPTPAQ